MDFDRKRENNDMIRKTTLALALLLAMPATKAWSQVKVEKEQPRCEFPVRGFLPFTHELASDTYSIIVRSDNEYESRTATIELGALSEAAESVSSMLSMMKEEGDYSLSGRRCHAYRRYIYFYNEGDLEYAAGSYILTESNLKKCLKWLNEQVKDSPVGVP